MIQVAINGTPCPPLFSSPWEVDVTDLLYPGTNTVSIILTNGLRNLLGPHHHIGGEHTSVGPATFRANDEWPHHLRDTGEPDWYDARRDGRARAWRDDYYLIPFGFLHAPVLLNAR